MGKDHENDDMIEGVRKEKIAIRPQHNQSGCMKSRRVTMRRGKTIFKSSFEKESLVGRTGCADFYFPP